MPLLKLLTKNLDVPHQDTIGTYRDGGGYESLKKALGMTPAAIVDEVKKSGLRGRGGAGASCGMKWGFMPQAPEATNYLICNCDESEPGTFGNHEIIEKDPHQLIESLVISSFALNVHTAFIYCRGEFRLGVLKLQKAVEEAKQAGFLGKNILGSGFDLEIVVHRGAGAYICGEETALMDSLEGRRGHPRAKPPFPAQSGLYSKPTTINNVETLCNIPWIINYGGEWFSKIGEPKSTGTKVLSVSGHVRRPGNYEIVMGTPMREVLYDICGGIPGDRALKGFIPGGSSMPILTANDVDVKMDFDSLMAAGSMMGSGGCMVFDETTSMPHVAQWIARFYAHESCGKCVPCRIGTDWMQKIIGRIVEGAGRTEDLDLLLDICDNIEAKSFCPLGDAAAWPVRALVKKYREEFEHLIRTGEPVAGVTLERELALAA